MLNMLKRTSISIIQKKKVRKSATSFGYGTRLSFFKTSLGRVESPSRQDPPKTSGTDQKIRRNVGDGANQNLYSIIQ